MGTKYVTVQVDDRDTGVKWDASRIQVSTTGILKTSRTLNIGTSEETVSLENQAGEAFNGKTPYAAVLRNHDATNFVQCGIATAAYFAKLWPENIDGQRGLPAFIPLDPSVQDLFLKADTAACDVELEIWFED